MARRLNYNFYNTYFANKETMKDFFVENQFMPHGHCYFWEPYLLWSHAIADSLIAIAYFLISFLLINIYQRRKDFGYKWVVGLFALFIMSCGIT
ncbi:MAG: hypothetical protein H7Y04_08640, partial [Verrucomicrobia bacterium]|nr:hypothetical protein [Cytophagales bacterium]